MSESETIETAEDWEAALAEEDDFSDLDLESEATEEAPEAEAETEPEEVPQPEESEAESEAEVAVEATDEPAEVEGEAESPEAEVEAREVEPPPVDDQPAPELVPWSAKADGVEIALEGAHIAPDGTITMSRDTWQKQLQPYLADRGSIQASYDRKLSESERRFSELESTRSEAEAQAQRVVQHFADLLEKGPDAAWQWFQDFEQNKAVLAAELQKAGAEAKVQNLEGRVAQYDERFEAQRAQEAVAQFNEWAPTALDSTVGALLDQPELADAGLDRAEVLETLNKLGHSRLFFTASEDIPEWGVRKGEIAPDWDFIARQISIQADLSRKLRSQADEVAQAAKANAEALRERKSPPPVVPAGGAPSVGSKRTPVTSKDEWEAALMEDDDM